MQYHDGETDPSKPQSIVAYGGNLWRCFQSHTSQADWTPDLTAPLWGRFHEAEAGPQPWVQPTGAHDAYRIGDRVTHNGWIWECTAGDANGNNVWEPGVYGWTKVEPV